MSDFRFAGRWLNDRRVMTLSGDDFKAFVTAGTWMVENRTDGHITRDDLEFIPRFNRSSIDRLTAAGLWEQVKPESWQMVDFFATQTSRAEFQTLENARRREREKKARQRAKQSSDGGQSRGTVPGDYTGQEGQEGQAMDEGEAWYDENADIDTSTGEVITSTQPQISWPVREIPSDPGYCSHGMTVGLRCGKPGCDGVAKRRSAA